MSKKKRTIKDKNVIYVDRDTYRKLLLVYKKHSKIPFHERIKINDAGGEKDE